MEEIEGDVWVKKSTKQDILVQGLINLEYKDGSSVAEIEIVLLDYILSFL